ncbi:thioredoxin family protein [Desulfosarcina sp.]|uniref:thioredoxin family protein n=1 Tax=Desulfosarcina sp. TaxID=2027861 RepID=UPI003970CB0B
MARREVVAEKRSAEKNFQCSISKGVTLVDFNAPWCKPCRVQARIIHRLEKDYHGKAKVTILNIDKNQNVAFRVGIQSIPTIIIFKDGKEIHRFIGLQSIETLDRALRKAIDPLTFQPHPKNPIRR